MLPKLIKSGKKKMWSRDESTSMGGVLTMALTANDKAFLDRAQAQLGRAKQVLIMLNYFNM